MVADAARVGLEDARAPHAPAPAPAAREEFPRRVETPSRADFGGEARIGIERATHPYLCVYASQIAVCIGANKHKKVNEAIEAMWQRIAPHSFFAAMQRNGLKTEDQSVTELMALDDDVKHLVTQTLVMSCESSAQVAANYDTVTKKLEETALAGASRKLVDDVLKRNLYTTYGNAREHEMLEYIRDTLGIQCRADPAFYKERMGEVEGVPWFVGGKIDAINEDRTLVVEIKNRVNRLFYRVPFYETVQVQSYLQLLDVDRGALVECLKTHGETHVNVIPVQRDRQMWARDVVPKLRAFVGFLLRILRDERLQDKFLQSPRRSVLVLAHMNAAVRAGGSGSGGARGRQDDDDGDVK